MSVLGTFTPLGERSRHGSFARTAVLYMLSAAGAGAALAVVLESVVAALGRVSTAAFVSPLLVAGSLGAAMIAVDVLGRTSQLPYLHRQVSEEWLGRLRPTIYSLGFGGQLGVAFTTHVATAATYAAFGYAALTDDPALAAVIGGSFGLTRGALVLISRRAGDPISLARIHQRVLGAERPVRLVLRLTNAAVVTATIATAALTS